MPVINTNLSALIAQNAARASEIQSAQSMERLSTGQRINSAKDDAAGLAIATRMTSAIRGFGMSLKNASDGISMAQTAEGALGNITDVLQRLRELAIQSANGSNSNTERSFLDSEASGLVAEVARIGAQTNFNNSKLLNGTFGSQTFQLGYLASDSIVFSGIDDGFDALDVGLMPHADRPEKGRRLSAVAIDFTVPGHAGEFVLGHMLHGSCIPAHLAPKISVIVFEFGD